MSKSNTFSQILFVTVGILFLSISQADEICEMRLSKCPEDFNNKTIVVPKKVALVSSSFFVCMPQNFIESVDGGSGSPSIMFVIDHSGSMSGINGNSSGTDAAGTRFTVTNALIDTIQIKYPNAEIGVVIFQEVLYLDTRNQPYTVPLPANYPYPSNIPTQGYIPLMRLDSILSNGQTSIQMIKELLTTEKVTLPGNRTNPGTQTTDLVYKPRFNTQERTNINTALDAAKEAMLSASNPKENQFVIFLSDGEPMPNQTGWTLHGNKNPYEFQNGTNMPTTFTVYFVPRANDRVPRSISEMTQKIQINNYSKNNPISNVWSIQTSYDTLLNTLMNQAINPILSLVKKQPTKLVLNNVTYEGYSTADSSFLVPDLYLKDSITTFDMNITYKVRTDTSTKTTDSITHITFDVVRTDMLPMSDGVLLYCSDTIYYKVSVNALKANASEKGPTNGIIQFSRNSNKHGDLTVYFTVSGSALPDIDYQRIADSVVFIGDQKNISYLIKPIVDSLEEGVETVIVTLLNSKLRRDIRYLVSSPNSAIVSIDDHFVVNIPPDTVTLFVTPNPYPLLGGYTFDGSFSHYFNAILNSSQNQNKGALIALHSTKKLEIISGESYGTALIYDAVGNLVKNLELKKANNFDSTYYGMLWDCTNNNKRLVGGGVYLLKVKIKNTDGISRVLSRKIGLKY